MSPRAAWRLEAFGYGPVYDYVVGKADWLATGLPSEGGGSHPPRAVDAIDRDVLSCTLDEKIGDIATRLDASGASVCVVVNDFQVVQGRIRIGRLDPADTRAAADVMEPGPATIRADADLAETLERMTSRKVTDLIVTTPEGVLLGVLHNQSGPHDDRRDHRLVEAIFGEELEAPLTSRVTSPTTNGTCLYCAPAGLSATSSCTWRTTRTDRE